MKGTRWALCLFLLIPLGLRGQEVDEALLEEQAESSEASELLELLTELREHPLNVNEADEQALARIPQLSRQLARAIVRHREKHGHFGHLEGLLQVPGIDRSLLAQITEFITVGRRRSRPRLTWRGRMLDRRPREDPAVAGASRKVYQRLRAYPHANLEAGLLLEKDPGERRLDDLRQFYLAGRLADRYDFVLGHYQLEFAQGLIFWGPYAFSKGASPIYPTRKRPRGLRGYTSVDENASLYGIAGSAKIRSVRVTAFVSSKRLDATPISGDAVSGFYVSGLHRTDAEKAKRDQIRESLVGLRLEAELGLGFSLGVSHYTSRFDKRVISTDSERRRFAFQGRHNSLTGLDVDGLLGDFNLFAEGARATGGGWGSIAGVQAHFGAVSLAVLFRNYGANFHSLHGRPFSDRRDAPRNERGLYTGLTYRLTSSTRLAAFYDILARPWRTFFEPMPTHEYEFLGQISQRIGGHLRLTGRYREAVRQGARRQIKRQWRLQLVSSVGQGVRLRSRVELLRLREEDYGPTEPVLTESGLLIFQEVRLRPSPSWQLYARLTIFDTDSFESRIFAYEHDVPGVVTNLALFGRGTRWYVLLQYRRSRGLRLALKLSETWRETPADVWHSGSVDQRLAVQADIQL